MSCRLNRCRSLAGVTVREALAASILHGSRGLALYKGKRVNEQTLTGSEHFDKQPDLSMKRAASSAAAAAVENEQRLQGELEWN